MLEQNIKDIKKPTMSYITKKPEKLASAIYLVTGFFSDQEPLKWKLRGLASDLISAGLFLKDSSMRNKEQIGLEIRSLVLEITTLITIARNSGLVSDTNADIVSREFDKYLSLLGLPAGVSEEEGGIVLSPNYFSLEAPTAKIEDNEEEKNKKDKNVNVVNKIEKEKRKEIPREETKGHYLGEGYLGRVENFLSNTTVKNDKPKNLKEFGAVSVKRNSRQSVIINLLKRKKEIMIKDISPLINGCSEKTIQRELLAMVKKGVLRKRGEKRWSRYTLA